MYYYCIHYVCVGVGVYSCVSMCMRVCRCGGVFHCVSVCVCIYIYIYIYIYTIIYVVYQLYFYGNTILHFELLLQSLFLCDYFAGPYWYKSKGH